MPVIQRDFCRTAVARVSGKFSRTQITWLSRRLTPRRRSRRGARAGSRGLKRTKISAMPTCRRRMPMS
jgi:hypothetical protein